MFDPNVDIELRLNFGALTPAAFWSAEPASLIPLDPFVAPRAVAHVAAPVEPSPLASRQTSIHGHSQESAYAHWNLNRSSPYDQSR
jgi:hypothetical protein